jgi:hypothetical protein
MDRDHADAWEWVCAMCHLLRRYIDKVDLAVAPENSPTRDLRLARDVVREIEETADRMQSMDAVSSSVESSSRPEPTQSSITNGANDHP